jgi:pilus assembly protein Flp/PilA
MKNLFARFVKDESGVTAIEYGLIATLIGVVIIGGATLVGGALNTTFNTIAGDL